MESSQRSTANQRNMSEDDMTFRQEIKYTIQPNAQANYGGLEIQPSNKNAMPPIPICSAE
ncbi:hypothetical protein HBH64_116150 [Parastagonospora nodorum]|nr:hypothetical protein HBI01_059300 [Parastagonospora nodorum]KAH4310673.1 hypothetical protein HBI02_097760 [Parastagonospora nodorum]KAH4332970.1 hypothetical protein HBI00_048630 [Parastagonospora nodorum]KAH4377680.1 hypothetical protein HBH94_084900 [Parastagonospora nodorum]KAH4451205.1 hypothetical protein HBH90_192460 [Parastagonospora nodorum]